MILTFGQTMTLEHDLLNFHPLRQWLTPIHLWMWDRDRWRCLYATLFSIFSICQLSLIGADTVMAASLPDAIQPGGAHAGVEFKAPIPPNMRRFLAKPEADTPVQKVQDSSRIAVNAIQLDGVIDRPDDDISLTELSAFVEQKRLDFMAAQNAPQGTLTLQQLQEIAAYVAQYYRDRGFVLARAVIPPQTVAEERVSIRILEGILGNVTIEKNRKYQKEQLLRPFRGLIGQPVIKDRIEAAMLVLNDYPGLSTFGVFRPGLNPGETDLLVSIMEERAADTQLHVDNYGSEYTGEYRGRVDVSWNNPFAAIDRLSASFSKTYNPNNGTYGSLNYIRHAFSPENTFGIGISKNDYSLGAALEPFGIKGSTTLAQAYWRRSFHRSRLFNSYGLLQLSRKSAKLNVTEGEDRADELTVLSIESGFDWASSSRRHLATGTISYSQGFDGLLGAMEPTSDPAQTNASRRGGSGIYAGGKFSKVNVGYDHWYKMMPNHTLHVSLRSQFSQDLLTSLEQMPIGGPNSVRAYATSEFLRDKAVSTSVEWLMSAPGFFQWKAFGNKRWGELLQFSVFADYAKGWLNDPLASDREVVSLSGVGAGMHFNYEKFSARFEIASPLGSESSSNDRNPQYFFEMNYGF